MGGDPNFFSFSGDEQGQPRRQPGGNGDNFQGPDFFGFSGMERGNNPNLAGDVWSEVMRTQGGFDARQNPGYSFPTDGQGYTIINYGNMYVQECCCKNGGHDYRFGGQDFADAQARRMRAMYSSDFARRQGYNQGVAMEAIDSWRRQAAMAGMQMEMDRAYYSRQFPPDVFYQPIPNFGTNSDTTYIGGGPNGYESYSNRTRVPGWSGGSHPMIFDDCFGTGSSRGGMSDRDFVLGLIDRGLGGWTAIEHAKRGGNRGRNWNPNQNWARNPGWDGGWNGGGWGPQAAWQVFRPPTNSDTDYVGGGPNGYQSYSHRERVPTYSEWPGDRGYAQGDMGDRDFFLSLLDRGFSGATAILYAKKGGQFNGWDGGNGRRNNGQMTAWDSRAQLRDNLDYERLQHDDNYRRWARKMGLA